MSEISNIDDKLKNSGVIITKKENPIVYVFILVASVVLGIFSTFIDNLQNLSLGLMFVAAVLAIIGLKGVVIPKRVLKYVPTNEKIVKKEYYYDNQERKEIEDCLKAKGFEMLKMLPQGKGSSLRVVLYTTASGSYSIAQLQHYVPYEYRPVYDAE